MRKQISVCLSACVIATITAAMPAAATTISVAAGGNLQAAIDAARPGDTILLAPGATFVGNFELPVHGGSTYVTIRSAASDALLPASGVRITPADAAYLPRIVSPNGMPAIRTAASASYWRLMLLEIGASAVPFGTLVDFGDGDSAQNDLSLVPHHFVVDRVYLHGDATNGQRRGIGLNSADTTIVNSHVSNIKAISQDSQAIAGWNGPGPFLIENNYLEASGEVVLFGGDDPRIDQLLPSDVVIRGNTLTRPMAWRNPILPLPANVRVSLAGAGSLPAGTYSYRVVARRQVAGQWIRSSAAIEARVTAGDSSAVRIEWDAVAGAAEYEVYGRTSGAQTQYWRTVATTFTDDGVTAATEGTAPSDGTTWDVKNVLELKNARRVQIDHNILENNWEHAQSGTAILFTPRNQYGGCGWCRVEDVVFEYNTVRRTSGGIAILGWDDEQPSSQANNITIRHNEFSDLGTSYGGNGYFLYMLDGPLNVTVDHNTVISSDGYGVIMADQRAAMNFVFTNNVMRHNSYGIIGSDHAPGLSTIARYFPDSRIERNVLAGGAASEYPSGNLFPTIVSFESHFVAYAGGDYALKPATDWSGAATDGMDLGADMTELKVASGDSGAAPLSITTISLPPAIQGQPYSAEVTASGGTPGYSWQAAGGSMPEGLTLTADTGEIGGAALSDGDFTVSLTVTDSWGRTASRPVTLRVERALAAVDIVTSSLAVGVPMVPYAQTLNASGGSGSYVWSVTAGQLPGGLSLSANGVLNGTPLQPASVNVTITATDAASSLLSASRAFTLVIGSAINSPPSVSLTAPVQGAIVPVGSTMTLAAAASDADGVVTRVDFYVNGTPVGSASGPGFTFAWFVAARGSYAVRAIAYDDEGASAASATVSVSTRSQSSSTRGKSRR